VLARGPHIVPIPGMERRAILEDNVAAVDIELTDDELSAIEAVIPGGGVGDRYGQYKLQAVDSAS
jgi:aryl-alcohol dehydrogenase-like predicted oxidoreductase